MLEYVQNADTKLRRTRSYVWYVVSLLARLNSVLRGTNADVFKTLLYHYRPAPAKVIDVTCGEKHFWDKIKPSLGNATLDGGKGYVVVYSDIRPIGDFQVDYRFILDKYPELEDQFDVVVYDPPYTELTLRVNGVEKWLNNNRYGMDKFKAEMTLSDSHFQLFVKQAWRLLKSDGILIVKLQDTANWWHFRFWENMKPLSLVALHIHDLEQNWAENVMVKNAKMPIPLHAYWFILEKY